MDHAEHQCEAEYDMDMASRAATETTERAARVCEELAAEADGNADRGWSGERQIAHVLRKAAARIRAAQK